MIKIKYDTLEYDFYHTIKSIFNERLPFLHTADFNDVKDVVVRETDQSTVFHKMFYKAYDETVKEVYERFIKEVIGPRFDNSFVFQRKPTFRVHLPRNKAVGEFHKDGDYGHPGGEISFFLPVTNAFGTNTIWVKRNVFENDILMGDKFGRIKSEWLYDEFFPLECNYGEALIWDACHVVHGNFLNDTLKTRVSLDFRIIPLEEYREDENAKESLAQGLKFVTGGYYARLDDIS